MSDTQRSGLYAEIDRLTAEKEAAEAEAKANRDAYEGAREDLLDWKRRALEAEAVCREVVSQIDQGGTGGKVFARDNCIARARAIVGMRKAE